MSKDPRPVPMRKAEIGIITASREGKLDVVTRLVQKEGIPTDYQESEGGPTPLMTAAIGGYADIIKFLLDPGPGIKPAEINKQDREQRTALINAVLNNKVDCVRLLLDSGADPNLYSRNGWTPLYIAANQGNTEIARVLLQHGDIDPEKSTSRLLDVDMAIQNTVGGTVLMVACMQGHFEIVKSLLESGADVNVRDKQNWTALMKAADKGHQDVVKLLLANGADVLVADNTGSTVLHLEAVRALLFEPKSNKRKNDISDPDEETVLQMDRDYTSGRWLGEAKAFFAEAANQGHGTALCILGIMYHHGVGIEVDEERALACFQRSAAARDPAGLYNLAVCHQDGVATPKDVARALELFHEAALLGHAEAQSAVELAGDASAAARFLLQAAERGEMVESYRILPRPISLQLVRPAAPAANAVGAGPDAPRVQTNELMSSASSGREAELSQLLLAGGHAVNIQNVVGMTALSHAAKNGHHGCVTILLHHGADPNLLTANRWSPLHYAANREDVNIMTTLLQMGALRDAQNSAGSTPLMTSCKLGHIEGIQLLLCMGADPSITNESGMSTLDVALSHNQVQAAAALLRHPNVVATYF